MTTNDEGGMPNDLKVFDSGRDLAEIDLRGGDGFWDEVKNFAGQEGLDEAVDSVMVGRAAPRVWALLDEEGVTGSRVVAALTIARILSERGQKVIVLDADDRQPDLTRWAGRFEHEGWIDFVRYGASVGSCGVNLPWPGTQLLGVGTFCPTGIDGTEIGDLVGRLRRQADDIVLCLPLEQEVSPWLEAAGIRLLCWDRMRRSEQETEDLLAGTGEVKESLGGIIAFGPSEDRVEAEIEEALQSITETDAAAGSLIAESEIDVSVRIDIDAASLPTDDEVNEALAEQDDEVAETEEEIADETDEAVVEDEAEEEVPEPEPSPGSAPDADDDGDLPTAESEDEAARGSSPVFWRIGGLAAVLVVTIGVCWYMGFFGGGDEAPTELASAGAEADISPPPTVVEETVEETAEATADDGGTTDGTADADTDPVGTAGTEGSEGSEGEETSATQGLPDDSPAETPEPAPVVEDLQPDWYSAPVGEAGWALHVYSFADSTVAVEEVQRLQARDIRGVWRVVELPDKGRWYRVYVGSFADRAEAKSAEEELLPRLGIDWAQPVRF